MQQLLSHITDYLDYLIQECNLSVSVHFEPAIFSRLPLQAIDRLLPYNIHRNPFCIMVKTDAAQHQKCVSEQHALYRSAVSDNTGSGYCRVCHAGVLEYVLPLSEGHRTIGIIAASGYRKSCSEQPNYLHQELWESALKPEEPPAKLCDTLLFPLAAMLEKLLTYHASVAESEYNLMLQYLSEYHSCVTLDAFCSHFGRSRSYVSHMFKHTGGVSFRSYCNRLKLEDARKLLVQTDLPVTQIALDTGFNDVSYFISLFGKEYGQTPLQYRKRHLPTSVKALIE